MASHQLTDGKLIRALADRYDLSAFSPGSLRKAPLAIPQ
jgi:hypothetical protein